VRPGVDSQANSYAADLGRGEVVGKVVNRAGRVSGRKLQVRAGVQEWTVHVPDNAAVMNGRQPVSVHDINLGTYVRAIGTRIGNTRLKADRLYIIGDRLALARKGYPRNGYYATYAGYRGHYRRVY
jgi:hypothetical protein